MSLDRCAGAVALRGCGRGRLARHRVRARRHDDGRFWMALGDAGGDGILIVCAVAGERGDRVCDLIERGADLGAVIGTVAGQQRGEDLPSVGIHANVQLSPGPVRLCAVPLLQPLAGATQLQPRAVHQKNRTCAQGCCNELLRLLHTQDRRCESRNGSDMVEAGARRRFSVAHRDRLDDATHLGIDL